ncbi:MAG: hypothetical protein LBV78_06805, partial [Kitasatospora sp.]|nr:hypothetical protein [Kitasatospora sp.]
TLARLYADDHPGVLNLDIDQVRFLVGGWRDRFTETGQIVRPLALAMAQTHLRGDRDVILPQYLGRLGEIERFETSARDSGAAFCEIVLMDTKQRAQQRFYCRDDDGDLRWHRYVQQVVERHGGPALLADMHDRLSAVLAARPDAIVLPSTAGAVEETYQALTAILHPPP